MFAAELLCLISSGISSVLEKLKVVLSIKEFWLLVCGFN